MKARSMTRREVLAGASAALAAHAESGPVRLPKKIRVGMIGFDGHYSEILDPLPRLPDVDVVAIADSDAGKMASAARHPKLAAVRQYRDYGEMLERESLDLVAVNNNNGERAAAVLACTDKKLNVIAEKPLAIERGDLEKVRKSVTRNGVKLSMLLPMRFSPPYLALKRIVDSGEIGEVAQIGAQKSYKVAGAPEWRKRRATYGGTIPWVGIHMVDLMLWTSGRDFKEVASFQARIGFPEIGDAENSAASLFRMDNGGAATLRMDYLRPETAPSHGDDRLRLAGTKGIAEYYNTGGVTLVSSGRKLEEIRELPAEGSVFVDFLESVYLGKTPALTMAEIWRVNEVVLRAREAAEQGRVLHI
ncbi:MAG TPA: Gfo/Idh/MocA family oxidoreductase [Bryobacteraceae bacterium]|nr:Gfo/Idh/MocA family oxidoreductase [Bryobacteraceae bacterium]